MLNLVFLLITIILIAVSISRWKLHPFLVLLLACLLIGYSSGMKSDDIINKITSGFGGTLASIGIVIALGTIIGTYLEKSGGAQALASFILKKVGDSRSTLAMSITGFIVSIPVFCDSGFVILSPLNKALSSKTGIQLVVLAIALATGLYATHVFVPPTPGPLAAAAALHADVGLIILYGIVVAIPVTFAGYLWANYYCNKYQVEFEKLPEKPVEKIPAAHYAFTPLLVPIILISLKSISDYPAHPFGNGLVYNIFTFIGHPVIALLIGVFLSFQLHSQYKKTSVEKEGNTKFNWIASSLKEAGTIILITGAGGSFGSILRSTNIAETISGFSNLWHIGIFLPFIIAAILKTAQGSSTVSIITTAAIMSPLLIPLGLNSQIAKVLVVLSIGAGAMTVSHLNDSYFWVVSQFSEMDASLSLKTLTSATLVQGLTGIGVIFILKIILV